MPKPVVVTIPHRLGRQEAARRLKSGLGRVVESFGSTLMVVDQNWPADDHLDFHVRALGQTTIGSVQVADDHVRLEVELPWGLGAVVGRIKHTIETRGRTLLEKK